LNRQAGFASGWAQREARRIQKAIALLQPGIPGSGGVWADIGCGDGIFTSALYTLIQPDGEIHAVDRDQFALDALARNFAESYLDATLHTLHADFTRELTLPALDGMIMANSLHFIADKAPVLSRLIGLLKPGGRLIVVEYNARRGNSAVPYPRVARGAHSVQDSIQFSGRDVCRYGAGLIGHTCARHVHDSLDAVVQ